MTPPAPPLAGVIGWPIGHSLSPRLHGHWLRRYGIDAHYVPLGLEPAELEAGLLALPRLGFRGVNVTIPHKETVLTLAASVSERAARIGAANTLSFTPQGFHADNTDGYGFAENLRQAAPGWQAARGPALVLGAGGAARAIAATLLTEGAPEVRIANRTFERAQALCAHFTPAPVVALAWTETEEALHEAAMLVNTTSLGMTGQPPLDISLETAASDTLVCDIVYRPLETPLLAAARARALPAVDGLGMLLHQAAPGFEAWFGRRPQVDDALRAAVLGA